MTSIQPELWVDRGAEAVTFYQAAFGATVLHRVGDGEDIVDQLAIGDAAFWVSTAGPPASASTPRRSAARPAAPSSSPVTPRRSSAARSPQVPPTAPRQTNTAGGLPGSQTRSAINGKSGAPRHLAATPTLTTTGNWRMPAQAAVPARADHPVQRPPQMAA